MSFGGMLPDASKSNGCAEYFDAARQGVSSGRFLGGFYLSNSAARLKVMTRLGLTRAPCPMIVGSFGCCDLIEHKGVLAGLAAMWNNCRFPRPQNNNARPQSRALQKQLARHQRRQ
jgi:hypothetical protein